MDSCTKGKLQGLLALLKSNHANGTGRIAIADQTLSNIQRVKESVQSIMSAQEELISNLQESQSSAASLKVNLNQITQDNLKLKEEKEKLELEMVKKSAIEAQLKQTKYKIENLESEFLDTSQALHDAEKSLEEKQRDIKQLSNQLENRELKVQELFSTIQQRDETISNLEDEVADEKFKVVQMQQNQQTAKEAHQNEIQQLKLEYGEKLLKVQSKSGGASSTRLPSSGINYMQIYKRKTLNMEMGYKQQIADLQRQINVLQQQSKR